MYKIFINEFPLRITNNENDFFSSGTYRVIDDDEASILSAIEMLENSDRSQTDFGIMVMTENVENTFSRISKLFESIDAAGGLVYNELEELLLIKRQGKWDLPKGKVDDGETIERAALREVTEECGLKEVEIKEFFTKTFHTYFLNGKRILKITHWYKMYTEKNQTLVPQSEENITEVKWFDTKTLDPQTFLTYNSIRSILVAALMH
jgi:ADP-ribose pyrophosphatase YjhB (NUDIX family)